MRGNGRSVCIEMSCSKCGTKVKNVDEGAASVICYRCVIKISSPNTIFLDELDSETLKRYQNKNMDK